MVKLQEKIKKANSEIERVANYLKEHEEAFRPMNLKLYDAFYYFMSDEMKKDFPLTYEDNDDTSFNWFCEDSYRSFVEDMTECYGINFEKMQNFINRTSRFYLYHNIIEVDKYEDICINKTIENFICDSYSGGYSSYCEIIYDNNYSNFKIDVELLNRYFHDENIDYSEDIENELDYIINELYNDVTIYCHDIIRIYNEVKNFKDNQVKYFKEYLACEEEELELKKEEEERIEKENKDNCINIKNKYNISDEDMKTLQKCIRDYKV